MSDVLIGFLSFIGMLVVAFILGPIILILGISNSINRDD